MKFRQEKSAATEVQEKRLEEELRALDRADTPAERFPGPHDPYWPGLIVHTNRKIDNATSGKALSISWAARVAFPGIVAILSFLIGIHYYAPVKTPAEQSLTAALQTLPEPAIDSLISSAALTGEPIAAAVANDALFDVTSEQIADYFISNESSSVLVESMSDRQIDDVVNTLRTRLQ